MADQMPTIIYQCELVRLRTYPERQRVGIEAHTTDGGYVSLALTAEQIEGLIAQIHELKAQNWGAPPLH